MCFMVKLASQPIHLGAGSPSIRYECVSREWPIRSRVNTTSSRRFIHCNWWCSVKSGTISLSLFVSMSSHCCFLLSFTYWAGLDNQSAAGTMEFETGDARAAFAAWSAASFPLIPTWLGTQQKMTSLVDHWIGCPDILYGLERWFWVRDNYMFIFFASVYLF